MQRKFFSFTGLLTTGAVIVPFFFEMYNPSWTTCAIGSIPVDCKGDECYRGAYSYLYFYSTAPFFAAAGSCLFMYRIYRHVKNKEATDESTSRRVATKGILFTSTYVIATFPYLISIIAYLVTGNWNKNFAAFGFTCTISSDSSI